MLDRSEFGREFVDALLQTFFPAFLAKVFETVSPGDEFAANWHLDAIAWELSRIEAGDSKRLLVTMPPRHLKSIAISVAWVAWVLGHTPSKRFVCASYSQDLALEHAAMCKMVMQSEWYRRIFPRTRLRGRAPDSHFQTTSGGARLTTSTGGTLTGRGGDIFIIDDPLKADDAFSDTMRQKCVSWYKNTLVTRPNDKKRAAIVLVMQRLHEEDLAGHVLSERYWHHLNLPAIATERDRVRVGAGLYYGREIGVPLHPARDGLAELDRMRRSMGSDLFDAQFQQQPIPAGGLMVKRPWLQFYTLMPTKATHGGQIVQCWDAASKEGIHNDYSACVTALVCKRTVYILHVYRAKLNFPKLLKQVRRLAREWRADVLLVEDAASGTSLIEALRDDPHTNVPSPIPRPATTDKVTRLSGQTNRIEAGDMLLPEEAPWLAEFLHELLGFPKAKHDDQVDALVHLLAWSAEQPEPASNASPSFYNGMTDTWTGGELDMSGSEWSSDDDPWGPAD